MQNKIVIFGAGGFAREVLQVILDINHQTKGSCPWNPIGFVVDASFSGASQLHDLPVHTGLAWLKQNADVKVVIAVGSPAARMQIARRISQHTPNAFATVIHPMAWVGRQVKVGPGSVICAGCQITTDIALGAHVHVNIGCTVGHDSTFGDFVTLNPGVNISGNVALGPGCEIGTGSVLLPHVQVGEWAIAGAGTVVTKTLPPNVTAVGIPARIVKTRASGWQER